MSIWQELKLKFLSILVSIPLTQISCSSGGPVSCHIVGSRILYMRGSTSRMYNVRAPQSWRWATESHVVVLMSEYQLCYLNKFLFYSILFTIHSHQFLHCEKKFNAIRFPSSAHILFPPQEKKLMCWPVTLRVEKSERTGLSPGKLVPWEKPAFKSISVYAKGSGPFSRTYLSYYRSWWLFYWNWFINFEPFVELGPESPEK